MARLLNMPHLEEESEYMKHCVGTSDSYVNKIKRGEVEILSFRHVPKINQDTGKFEGDTPVMTIEYKLKTKTIEQMKKYKDVYLTQEDPYYEDVIDALKQLRSTQTDTGELRGFKSISESELEEIRVQDRHILTDKGEISLDEYTVGDDVFILKMGDCEITKATPKGEIAKLLFLKEGITVDPKHIATSKKDINEHTKVYVGYWSLEIHEILPATVEHIYNQNLENRTFRRTIDLSTRTNEEYLEAFDAQGMHIQDWAKDNILLTLKPLENKESVNLVLFSVADLGFPDGAILEEIYARAQELGLDLCDPHVGPEMRLAFKDQPLNSYYRVAMEPVIIDADGYRHVWDVFRRGGGLLLGTVNGGPARVWAAADVFVFSSHT